MSLVKAKFIKKEQSKMKKDIDANVTTEQEIPTFKDLRSELGCENCTQRCKYDFSNNWKNASPNSKWECEKEKRKVKIIETVVFAVVEIIAILFIYFLLKNIFITIFLGVALVGVMIWFDFEKLDKLQTEHYQNLEEERKRNFEKEVEKTKANNEAIRRKANGETEEYLAFKEKAKNLTQKICEQKKILDLNNSIVFEGEKTENTIIRPFSSLYNNLKSLTDKISPDTFEYAYIQKFYLEHLPSLIESIETYYGKNEDDLSVREKASFERLIEAFDRKIENVATALAEQTENEFVSKMENLQNQMLNNK